MLDLLLTLLIMLLVFGVVYWIITLIPGIPPPIRNIALAIVGVIMLIYLLSMLFGAAPPFRLVR